MLKQKLGPAQVEFNGKELRIATGSIERIWSVIPAGLSTKSLVLGASGREWIANDGCCDWNIHGVIGDDSKGRIGEVDVKQVINPYYTSDHLEVEVPFVYEAEGFHLLYRIWVYPDAYGVRTQLDVRALHEFGKEEMIGYLGQSYAERLRLKQKVQNGVAIGYYNDPQHRNYMETPILKEDRIDVGDGLTVEWASAVFLEQEDCCITLVKESHKCVNQQGVDTGYFRINPQELIVTGLGLTANHYANSKWYRTEKPRKCWANWTLLTHGNLNNAVHGLKRFDRTRFPFRPERSAYMIANTWGSGGAGEGSRRAACETNVLRELESVADLGLDVLQIDEGWEVAPETEDVCKIDWRPHPARYPDGWKNVKEKAEKLNICLGLWNAWTEPLEAFIKNYRDGGFKHYKIDYMNLDNADDVEKVCELAIGLIENTDPTCQVNWDNTENYGRVGYFFARDYGLIYLANRIAPPAKNSRRTRHVIYRPCLVLRDAWQLSKYMNLNQIQLTVQNVDRIDPAHSNASAYSHDYCFAITMMGVPIFFQETHLYTEKSRQVLRPIINVYKEHRSDMFKGFVEAIGDEPNDRSWTGFHNYRKDLDSGYLTIFREIESPRDQQQIIIPKLAGKVLRMKNLMTNETETQRLDENGCVTFQMKDPASYRFIKYEAEN